MNTLHNHHTGTERRHSIPRVVTATAIGLSALSVAFATPAAAKGPHPGPVIDRPEPTSSLSAQTNDGHTSTAPLSPAGHMAPGAIPRSQPTTSVSAQRYRESAGDASPNQVRKASASVDAPGDTARRADVHMPAMPSGLTAADAGRLFGGPGSGL
ncbi:hypothetical protein [Mycolicibacterium sp. CBMA 226]|uniref:hypothetical protein n=1 Tax=Mycolicibacterium sp. CBMA 226 TaxID=2606611 RepID=UPI0012DDFFC0|nr:hypothetical protein [Mycolicibacterium sp. CBMA 226]MUL78161.1 hypothetical protein [Mycolicibacterium sp. CBMA 226]